MLPLLDGGGVLHAPVKEIMNQVYIEEREPLLKSSSPTSNLFKLLTEKNIYKRGLIVLKPAKFIVLM